MVNTVVRAISKFHNRFPNRFQLEMMPTKMVNKKFFWRTYVFPKQLFDFWLFLLLGEVLETHFAESPLAGDLSNVVLRGEEWERIGKRVG